MAKKKTPRTAPRGRPKLFAQRVSWLIWLDAAVVKRVDKRRGDVSQSQLVEGLLKKWLEE